MKAAFYDRNGAAEDVLQVGDLPKPAPTTGEVLVRANEEIDEDRVKRIEVVCHRHNVRLVEAALKFPLMHPAVVSVIPGGQSVDQVKANRTIFDRDIPAPLWADLKVEGLLREDAPTG